MKHPFVCLILLSLPTLLAQPCWSLDATEAYELLRKSDKWRLIETLAPENRAKVREAEAAFRPKAGLVMREVIAHINPLEFGLTTSTPISTVGFGSTAIEAEWTLLDPLSQANILLARSKESVTAEQARQYQVDLTAGMLLQLLNVQKLQKQFDLSSANLEKSQLILKLASAKHQVGAGIPLDVARAESLVSLDRIKKMAVFNKLLKAKHDLALTLGFERLDTQFAPIETRELNLPDQTTVLKWALDHRPDLQSSRVAVDAAHEAFHEASRTFFPKLQVLGNVGRSDTSILGLTSDYVNGYLGVSFSIPIDASGLIEAKRLESKVMVSKSEIGLREKINEVTSEIKEALENLSIAKEGLVAAQAYVKTAQTEAQIAEHRFEAGSSNGLDLSSALTNLASSRDNLNDSKFNYEAAKVTYFRARGDFTDYFEAQH